MNNIDVIEDQDASSLLVFPPRFADFIRILIEKKELLLAGALERQCACETWSRDVISIRADPAAYAVLQQRLRSSLKIFEGGNNVHISIDIADNGEILSEAEKQRNIYAEAEKTLLQSDEMQRIRAVFPQVTISRIDVSS